MTNSRRMIAPGSGRECAAGSTGNDMKISRLGVARLIIGALLLLCAAEAAQAQVGYRAAANARQNSNVSGGTITVNKPAGTVSGDVMVASLAVVTNAVTVATPAGWTLITSVNQTAGNTSRLYAWYKVAGAAEPANYAWTFTGAHGGAVAAIGTFTGVDTAAPIDVFTSQTTASGTAHTALSVTSTVPGDMLVTVHEYASSRNWSPPVGMTEFVDRNSRGFSSGNGVTLEMNRLALPVAGATGNKTANAPGNADRGATISIALKAFVVVTTPGDFNTFDTGTPAGITGNIMTKVAAANFDLDIVAINPAKTGVLATFTGAVKMELLNTADDTGALDANDCRPTWTTIQTVAPNPTFVPGDKGRHRVSNINLTGAYPKVRVRITYPAVGAPTSIGCSSDLFAIRPHSFTGVAASDATSQTEGTGRILSNIGAAGGVVHKAGRPFRISAFVRDAAGAGIAYSNTAGSYYANPQANLVACLLPAAGCALGTLDELGAAASWTAGAPAGNFYTASATYDDAGSFTMQLVDMTFAAADASDGTPADCSAAGQYICSASINVGRFVPDAFELVDASTIDPEADPSDTWLPVAAPQFRTFGVADAACNAAAPAPRRSFTYVGQSFGYISVPQFTFKAVDASGGSMANYSGALMKLTAAGVAQTYSAATGTLDTALALAAPTLTLNAHYTNGDGSPIVGSFAIDVADRLSFTRAMPVDPFDAVISLSVNVTDSSENGVGGNGTITSATPLVFNGGGPAIGISFDSGKVIRYGRLEMQNAHGSQALDLNIPMEVQYCASGCAATPIWQRNTSDHCTTLPAGSFALGNYNILAAANMPAANLPATATVMNRGAASLLLRRPTDGTQGSVDVTVNLGNTLADVCNPPGFAGPQPAAPPTAGLAYLQGKWCGANYDRDPLSRATFGIYRSRFIYRREVY